MAGPTAIVDLNADVKPYLGETGTSKDTLLQGYIDAATAVVQYIVGNVVQQTVTEWHDGGNLTITLRQEPVLSVTSVTEYIVQTAYPLTEEPLDGSTSSMWGYTFEQSSAQISRRVNTYPAPFAVGERNVKVVYISGRASVPADIKQATLDDIRGLWAETQRGQRTGRRSDIAAEEFQAGPPLHLFPRLASVLVASQRLPGIA